MCHWIYNIEENALIFISKIRYNKNSNWNILYLHSFSKKKKSQDVIAYNHNIYVRSALLSVPGLWYRSVVSVNSRARKPLLYNWRFYFFFIFNCGFPNICSVLWSLWDFFSWKMEKLECWFDIAWQMVTAIISKL